MVIYYNIINNHGNLTMDNLDIMTMNQKYTYKNICIKYNLEIVIVFYVNEKIIYI